MDSFTSGEPLDRVNPLSATVAVLTLVALLSLATNASAQSDRVEVNRSTFTVTPFLSIEPEGDKVIQSPHEINPLGGNTFGLAASIGHELGRGFGVDFAVRSRGAISGTNGFEVLDIISWTEAHRELAFDTMVVIGRSSYRRLGIEPLIGATVVWGVTERTNTVARPYNPLQPSRALPDSSFVDVWFGIAYGVNAAIAITPKTAIVPSVRGYWMVNRETFPQGHVLLGSALFDLGVGFRINF